MGIKTNRIKKRACLFGTTVFILSPLIMSGAAFAAAKAAPVKASTSNKSSSSSTLINTPSATPLIQSYAATSDVTSGMFVGLKSKGSMEVIPLTSALSKSMLGIVIPASDATFTLTPTTTTATTQVLVATSGTYSVLVSNQNGDIKAGDYLTMSSASGVAMEATTTDQESVGQALQDYSGSTGALSTTNVKAGAGQKSKVSIGTIEANIRLAPNPSFKSSTGVPSAIEKTAATLAGQSVSNGQVFLSVALLILTLFTTGTIYYSGVSSSIVSIGRNPLSKKHIVGGLIKVLLAGMIVFAVGAAAAFLTLKS